MGRASRQRVQSAVPRATWHGGVITPGLLDETAREAYTNGQCAYLARALQEASGGQIWAIVDCEESPDEVYDPREHVLDHFGVEIDGQILDIEGSWDAAEWEERYSAHAVPVELEDLLEWQEHYQLRRQWIGRPLSDQEQMELARSFVAPLLSNL